VTNEWKAVWNRRQAETDALTGSWQNIFLELKRLNGFDVVDGGIPLDSLLMQGRRIVELLHLTEGMSVYDVGCGAGQTYISSRAAASLSAAQTTPVRSSRSHAACFLRRASSPAARRMPSTQP
jgi:magnesium protoporphyrin O-methyltransferase